MPLIRRRDLAGGLFCALLAGRCAAAADATGAADAPVSPPVLRLAVETPADCGDLDAVFRRSDLRILVPYSPTLLFEDRGEFCGLVADIAVKIETWLCRRFTVPGRTLVVSIRPCTRNHLFSELLAGRGDLALGDITITPERQALVAFTRPTGVDVREIVVTAAGHAPLKSAEDLSGQPIAAAVGTSPHASLQALNRRLVEAARPPCRILDLPGELEVEDMAEMLAAGLLPAIPMESWMADVWKGQISGLMVHPAAVLRDGGETAWAVRPDNPHLLEVLNEVIASLAPTAARMNALSDELAREVVQMHRATSPRELARYRATVALFERYAPQYGFDELMLLAQGYQESRLDQRTRSAAGAIGLMQILPATGREMGVGDIREPDANVHAGAKYMRMLLTTYLADARFDEQNRALFAFACYNAGPARIVALRREAGHDGYDPNVWFNNVERIAARRIGQETVRYVRSIYKYYVGYRLIADSRQAEHAVRRALQAVPPRP